jgi:hypothetical protein
MYSLLWNSQVFYRKVVNICNVNLLNAEFTIKKPATNYCNGLLISLLNAYVFIFLSKSTTIGVAIDNDE